MATLPTEPALRTEPYLYEEFPALRATLPWRPLALVPTPVTSCDAIADYLGRTGVALKRDDLTAPAYGGNKVRRYEYLFAEAERREKLALYTLGGVASTQVTATAVLGALAGFRVRAVLYEQPVTRFAREALLADATAGAELVPASNFVTAAARLAYDLRRAPDAYLVPPGASTPRPNMGYFDAALELRAQVEAGLCPRPDAVVLPTGSAGTLAALALAFRYFGWPTEVVGVRIAPWIATNRLTVGHTLRSTTGFLARRAGVDARRFAGARYTLEHGFYGPGYGAPTPEALEGAAQWQRLTGAPGEVTYAGKALAALRALLQRDAYRRREVLLWATLSTPRPPIDPRARERLARGFDYVFERPTVA